MLEGSSPQETAEVWLASGEAKHAQSVPLILLKVSIVFAGES